LKAFADDNLTAAKLYSIEWSEDCEQGALIPDELRSAAGGFIPMHGKVEDFLKRDQLPGSIDMFLHDSSHSYRHMLWEFRQFWPRLRDGGLLVSHDVQMNAAFPEIHRQDVRARIRESAAAMPSGLRITNGAAGLHRLRD